MKDQYLAWIDIETTGLDPKKHQILEIAIIITNNYNILFQKSFLIKTSDDLNTLTWSVAAYEMHRKNNLLDDWQNDRVALPIHVTEAYIIMELRTIGLIDVRFKSMPIAGSSPHFDRAFLKEHMPQLESMFSHRNFDVSTLFAFFKEDKSQLVASNHRAMDDLLRDIVYTKNLFTSRVSEIPCKTKTI